MDISYVISIMLRQTLILNMVPMAIAYTTWSFLWSFCHGLTPINDAHILPAKVWEDGGYEW